MDRIIEPEWLDDLPPNDPRAIGSRRDLRRLNFWMGHAGIMRKSLAKAFPEAGPKRIVELGAGDGTLLLKLAQGWRGTEVVLVDRQPAILPETKSAFARLGCKLEVVSADVFEWLPKAAPADCVMANLFLHHFPPDALARLLRLVSGMTSMFIAAEPRRSKQGLAVSRYLGIFGCNAVTRHDAPISVRAGFCGNELSGLWPEGNWELEESPAGVSSHRFVAQKK